MENSLKGLILAAGVIITCVVVGLGFYIAREAKDTATNGAGQITMLNSEFSNNDKTIYDGITVSGSEVLNAIKKFKDEEISVKVVTSKSTTYYNYSLDTSEKNIENKSTSSVTDAKKAASKNYINPNGKFEGEIIRDSNDYIIGICFTQC